MKLTRLLLVLFVGIVLGCQKPVDDVTQIRAVIDAVASSAQKHDINGMMEHAASDYEADPGGRDEQAVRPLLLLALRKYGQFEVKYPVPGIELAEHGAAADVSVPFLIVRQGQDFPDLNELVDSPADWGAAVADQVADPYQLDLQLRKTPDGWKVHRSEIAGFKSVHDL